MNTKLAVIDTETTELDETAEVIEICIRDLKHNTIYHSYVMPLGQISQEASNVNGLDFEFLAKKEAPFWSDIVDDIKSAVEGYTLCAYNAPFDKRVIEQTSDQQNVESPMSDNDWVCASKSTNEYLGFNPFSSSGHYRLVDAFAELCPDKVSTDIKAHTAGDDVYMTSEIVKVLQSKGIEPAPIRDQESQPALSP
jgi:DNA polymerase-3 subunit epsilon